MSVLQSSYSDVDVPTDQGLADFMLRQFHKYKNATALVDGLSGESVTFSDLILKVRTLSSGLWRYGVHKGSTVCVVLANSLEFPIIFCATTYLGGIITACNPNYTTVNHHQDFVSLDDIMKVGIGFPPPEVSLQPEKDIAILPFSSGTTGIPKAVMLSHYNVIANICQGSHPHLENGSLSDTYVAFLPFFHIYGMVPVLMLGLYLGCKIVILPKFDLKICLQTIEKYKVTVMHLVPPIAVLLTKHPLVSEYDITSVHTISSGAAPLTREVAHGMMERLNVKSIRQGYGMTELSPMSIMCPPHGWKYGAIGTLLPNTQCKVIDVETGMVVGCNQKGELCLRGPQVMTGYLNCPEETAHILDEDRYIHTGDIVYYDEDQHFFIVDRRKELIKYKGFQVAPAELEGLLLTHPSVADVAVIGIPDSAAGEIPKAFIVKKGQTYVTERELQDFIKGKVVSYKRLRGGVDFVDTIPRSPSGKILRRLIKRRALNSKL